VFTEGGILTATTINAFYLQILGALLLKKLTVVLKHLTLAKEITTHRYIKKINYLVEG